MGYKSFFEWLMSSNQVKEEEIELYIDVRTNRFTKTEKLIPLILKELNEPTPKKLSVYRTKPIIKRITKIVISDRKESDAKKFVKLADRYAYEHAWYIFENWPKIKENYIS